MNITVETVNDPYLIYGTWALVIVTLIGIIITSILTKKSLNETKKSNTILTIDIQNRLRPFIQITDILPNTVTLQNNSIISWENYIHSKPKPSIKFVSFKGELKNLGSVPALDIKPKWLKRNSKIVRNDLDNGQEDPNFPLGVKESYPLTATITWDEYINSESKPYYVGIKINYLIFDKKEELGKIWKIQPTTITTEDYWINKNVLE